MMSASRVPDWLGGLVRAKMEATALTHPHLKSTMDEVGGLVILSSIGFEAAIRPDGTVYVRRFDPESLVGADRWEQATPEEHWGSITIASKRIPELKGLLPTRDASGVGCTDCGGTGFRVGGAVFCATCDALGWRTP